MDNKKIIDEKLEELTSSIKSNFKVILKKNGNSMQDIASELNITRETLTRNIGNNPTLKTLLEIAEVLNVNVSNLLPPVDKNELTAFVEFNNQISKATTLDELKKIVENIEGKLKE